MDDILVIDGASVDTTASTEAEAVAKGARLIQFYRNEAESDGGWPDGVDGVCIARVIHRAVVTSRQPREGDEPDAVDYGLEAVPDPRIAVLEAQVVRLRAALVAAGVPAGMVDLIAEEA